MSAEEEELAGAPLASAADARAAASRLLELDAIIKPLSREVDLLVPSLRNYMLDTGSPILLTELGSVELRSTEAARLDQALIPPDILARARVVKTQHSLFRKPDLVGIRQGVLRGMVAVGPSSKRARAT